MAIDTLLGKKEKIFVFGDDFPTKDGSGVRDYIHVEDIAEAHTLVINNFDKAQNEVFNLGTNEGYSVLEIINTVNRLYNVNLLYEIKNRRPGDPAALVASYRKIKNLLGWEPKRGLDNIIVSALEWRKNPRYKK